MYQVRINNGSSTELFSDPRIDDLAIINPVIHLEVNKTGTFTMTIPSSHPYYDEIQSRKTIVQVTRDGEGFQGVCVNTSVDFYNQKTVECEGELTYFNDSILRPAKYQGMTARELLEEYIERHNYQVEGRKQFRLGKVEVDARNIYCFTNYNSTMEEIEEDLLEDYGGYIFVRYEGNRKYIDYVNEKTEECEQTIRLGENLLNYSSNIEATEIATRVIPLGATLDEEEQTIPELDERLTIESVNRGLDYIEADRSMVSRFGLITRVQVWDDVHDPRILMTKGCEWLESAQFENVTIECKALDLGYIEDVPKFRLRDRVRIISEFHGMNKVFTLKEMEINLNEPSNDTFTFGTTEKYSLVAAVNKK